VRQAGLTRDEEKQFLGGPGHLKPIEAWGRSQTGKGNPQHLAIAEGELGAHRKKQLLNE